MKQIERLLPSSNVILDLDVTSKKRVFEHAGLLFEQARQPKYIERVRGDHNHILENQSNRNIVLQYLERFSSSP